MNTFIVQLSPKKSEFDPASKQVKAELVEAGENPKEFDVETERLFKISGEFSFDQIETISNQILVDPVVENITIIGFSDKASAKKKATTKGWVVDIWPKPGVTDPVGDTVVKALKDLGYKGEMHAVTAQRFIFPKLKDSTTIKRLAQQSWANQLIHDIHIEKLN